MEISTYKICCIGGCETFWNGEKESIFRSTSVTCAGEEIGWGFVEMVLKAKCSFTAYTEIMNDGYKRLGRSKKFMCPKTFRNWFWCWASHQGREFRKSCFACGDKVEAVASDGTMIGNIFLYLQIIHVSLLFHFIFLCVWPIILLKLYFYRLSYT